MPIFQDELLELTTDEGLTMNFENTASLALFWVKVKNPEPAKIALKSSSIPMNKSFSLSMIVIKTKHSSVLDPHYPSWVALLSSSLYY